MKATIEFSSRNTPTLMLDGKEASPVIYGLSDIPGSKANTAQARRNIEAFAKAGIRLVTADTGLHLGWYKHTPFDPEPLREEIAAVLDANPQAGVLLRLHMNPPYFWLRDHPEECVVYRTKNGDAPGIDNGASDRLIRFDGDEHMRASLASRLWIEEASEKLALFLRSLEGTREGDALIGIQVAGGVYGEWHQWGVDVSLPMRRRFAEHLKEKYKTEEALRAAWQDESITFESAEFHPERHGFEGEGALRDPRFAQRIIDARETVQLAAPEAILAFCRVVKENAPHLLAGAFYAYYFGSMDEHTTIYGHMFPELVFRARGVVDFLCGPIIYCENRHMNGIPMQFTLLESCRLNGILWLAEMDQHPFGTEKYVGGDPSLLAENIAVLRRNTLQPLLSGHGFWFYDHRIIPSLVAPDSENPSAASIYRKTGWWETPPLMAAIEKVKQIADSTLHKPYVRRADVLLVYDTESFFYRAVSRDEKYLMHESLARAGVAFDTVYKKDFCRCRPGDYKAIIFANCYLVKEEERALLRNTDALFIYMNGFGSCNGTCYSEENASLSAGITLAKTDAAAFSYGGERYEIKEEYRPVYAVKDADATPLALYDGGGVAVCEKGRAVFIPLPYIPLPLAKVLLQRAGAHMYTDSGESVLAGYDYLAVCCQRAGEREVYLPSGKTVTVKTEGYETVLLDISTGERVGL